MAENEPLAMEVKFVAGYPFVWFMKAHKIFSFDEFML